MKVPVTFVIRVLLMSVLLSNATSDAFAQATVPGSTIVPVSATEPGAAKADAAFRVDTYIYQDAKKEPVKETLTLFYEGAYYDFAMDATQAVTFIDPRRGRIVLLSPRRQIKTSFHTASLLNDVSEARTKITNSELASVLEAVNKVTFDDQSGKLKVGDTTLSYEATLQTPKETSMALQYADFADWSARLNAVLPPHFPPYLRLELNRQIATRGMLPQTILRVTLHNNRKSVIRSELTAIGLLSRDDNDKIQSVGELLQTCKEVPAAEFFGTVQRPVTK